MFIMIWKFELRQFNSLVGETPSSAIWKIKKQQANGSLSLSEFGLPSHFIYDGVRNNVISWVN